MGLRGQESDLYVQSYHLLETPPPPQFYSAGLKTMQWPFRLWRPIADYKTPRLRKQNLESCLQNPHRTDEERPEWFLSITGSNGGVRRAR